MKFTIFNCLILTHVIVKIVPKLERWLSCKIKKIFSLVMVYNILDFNAGYYERY